MSNVGGAACTARLRPLAAALALAIAPTMLHAATAARPGELHDATGAASREDGSLLRVALRAWHQDALRNVTPPATDAATHVVTTCADAGPGSLREAMDIASSGDTIDLGALTCATISLHTGALPAHADTLTLVGPVRRTLVIDGTRRDRVFLHYGGGTFTLRNLTVAHGSHRASGTNVGVAGCIASAGYVTLDHSTVTGCYASGEGAYGGGIYAYSLILASSTLSQNLALGTHPTNNTAAFGGGAFVYQIDLVDSTVTGNQARHRSTADRQSYDIGGGISTVQGGLVVNSTIDSNYAYGRGGGLATFTDLLVRNSTISGNTARKNGGGGLFIRFPADLDARNSTVTANRGPNGGGVMFTSLAASMQSSIIAGNDGNNNVSDLSASRPMVIAGSNNLVGAVSPLITLPADTLRGDPDLLPLANNGGLTRTHALEIGSAAIDAGSNPANLESDQRGPGFPRTIGNSTDIGAFEFNGAARAVRPVPALSAWALAMLIGLLVSAARRCVRKRVAMRELT